MKKCPQCGWIYQDSQTVCQSDGAALEKSGDALIGKVLAGKYRLDERISEGGMGAIYRGTHVLMGKTLAVKVLHPRLAGDEKIIARFSREARAASRIHHPHAISVFDFGEDGGVVFLLMEYVRGKTLKEVIRREGPLALGRAVEITRQICGALEAAHGGGVIHRDLKSENIMLEEITPGGDWVKVLDFGIAKIQEAENSDPDLTAPNLIIGTPQYMSPEQCSQTAALDRRSDVYSLGVILYEMLAGRVPFAADSPTEVMFKHLQEPPPSLLLARPELPPEIDRITLKALAKEPNERYQTAAELAAALDSVAAPLLQKQSAEESGPPRRIVIPTAEHQLATNAHPELDDEVTVIRPAETSTGPSGTPAPASNFNPWQIAFASLIMLLVGFGVFYAFQSRNANAVSEDKRTNLKSDPQSKPVEALAPPKGDGRRGNRAPSLNNANNNSQSGGVNINANAVPGGSEELIGPAVPTVNVPPNVDLPPTGTGDRANKGQDKAAPKNDGENKTPVQDAVVLPEPGDLKGNAPAKSSPNKQTLPKLPAPKTEPPPAAAAPPPATPE